MLQRLQKTFLTIFDDLICWQSFSNYANCLTQLCYILLHNTVWKYSNPFQANFLFLYPLKTSEKQSLSYIFRLYRNGASAWNGVTNLCYIQNAMLAGIFGEIDFSQNDGIETPVLKPNFWWYHFDKGLFQIRLYIRMGDCTYFWGCIYF